MKKLLMLCIVFCALYTVQAQKYKMTYGLAAGVNIANITDKFDGGSFTPDSRIGFKAFFLLMPHSVKTSPSSQNWATTEWDLNIKNRDPINRITHGSTI